VQRNHSENAIGDREEKQGREKSRRKRGLKEKMVKIGMRVHGLVASGIFPKSNIFDRKDG
jgi:hypothetical protein